MEKEKQTETKSTSKMESFNYILTIQVSNLSIVAIFPLTVDGKGQIKEFFWGY